MMRDDRGVVHQIIDRAEGLRRLRDQVLRGFLLAHVDMKRQCLVPERFQLTL